MMDAKLQKALAGDMTPKFLATLDAKNRPNCVPVISIAPYPDGTLVFGEFLMNKSRANLAVNDKVGVAVINSAFDGWSLKGTFRGFETTGERVNFVNNSSLLRYNAYTSVRAAGTIEIHEISEKQTLSKARLLCDFLHASAVETLLRGRSGAKQCMPDRVKEKYRRMSAVRAVAFLDTDGFPRAFPVMTCLAAGPNRLVMADPLAAAYTPAITANAELAVAIITMDPIAYQVKGRYVGRRVGVHVIDLTECYSASPPLVGDRLDT